MNARGLFLKKVTAFYAISMLVMSIAVLSAMGNQAAKGQDNQDNCVNLPIDKLAANGVTGTETAALVADGDSATRWQNEGIGSFIQADLGELKVVCEIDIAWYKGDRRSFNFVISTSQNGIDFKDIMSSSSTGKTLSPERYDLLDKTAKYVRVTVFGSSATDWGSINEMSIRGRSVEQEQTCTLSRITGVSANGNDGHLPQNTIDNNPNTRWSNFGLPSWIQYDLGASQSICDVDISWYRGNTRVNTFAISASNDGQNFQQILSGESSGKTIAD